MASNRSGGVWANISSGCFHSLPVRKASFRVCRSSAEAWRSWVLRPPRRRWLGQRAAAKVQELADAAKSVNPDILCLCHGGPIANPEDAQYVLDHTEGIVGFYGASSIERFPTEVGIRKQTEDFKAITFKR